MFTSDGIYWLLPDGKGFAHLDEIPTVTTSDDPVKDSALANSLLWELLNDSRGLVDPNQFPSWLLKRIDISHGAVKLRSDGPRIEGRTFRHSLSTLLNRFSKNDFAQLGSSAAIQLVFSELSSLFPGAKRIFDPFFGIGLSTFSAVDKLKDLSPDANPAFSIAGFEVNSSAFELATNLAKATRGHVDFDLTLASASDQDWPSTHLLLAQPPMGLLLREPISLRGVMLKNIEHFAILRAAIGVQDGSIRDGAVLITSRSWLSRNDCQNLRDTLLGLGVIKAVLGLPGLSGNTSLPLVAVVLKADSGRVVMGELFDDWASVLSGDEGQLHGLLSA